MILVLLFLAVCWSQWASGKNDYSVAITNQYYYEQQVQAGNLSSPVRRMLAELGQFDSPCLTKVQLSVILWSILDKPKAREVVQVLIYDRIKGFLNWMQPWFAEAAIRRCNTRCVLTDQKGEVIWNILKVTVDTYFFSYWSQLDISCRSPMW